MRPALFSRNPPTSSCLANRNAVITDTSAALASSDTFRMLARSGQEALRDLGGEQDLQHPLVELREPVHGMRGRGCDPGLRLCSRVQFADGGIGEVAESIEADRAERNVRGEIGGELVQMVNDGFGYAGRCDYCKRAGWAVLWVQGAGPERRYRACSAASANRGISRSRRGSDTIFSSTTKRTSPLLTIRPGACFARAGRDPRSIFQPPLRKTSRSEDTMGGSDAPSRLSSMRHHMAMIMTMATIINTAMINRCRLAVKPVHQRTACWVSAFRSERSRRAQIAERTSRRIPAEPAVVTD